MHSRDRHRTSAWLISWEGVFWLPRLEQLWANGDIWDEIGMVPNLFRDPRVKPVIMRPNNNRISIFNRHSTPAVRTSIFERLGETSKDQSNNARLQQWDSVFDRLGDGHIQLFKKKFVATEQMNTREVTLVRQHIARKPHGSSGNLNEDEIEIIIGSNHVNIDEDSDPVFFEDEIQNAPPQLEDGVQATVDELKELNLGTTEEPHPIFVSELLSPKEEKQYFKTLVEYKDVFAWTYKEMTSLDPKVAIHLLGTKHRAHPIKKSQKVLCPDLIPRVETEVNKLINAGFIREVKYEMWISRIVCQEKE
ncbi:UNVERIFIED_CONTAM: hypothetical protein Sangu_2830100 [Sesamum angustifolium]|uniref:Uncharacterized protein n=1 Tax=Sesamum angustifolium TaxID=2727405 RepID=A0AAW2IRE4_9LAMI